MRAHHVTCSAPARQRGAALVVGLLMLLVLTLLAFSSFGTATAELVMAGNEQYRRNASQAASAGIERAIARLGAVPTTAGAAPVVDEASVGGAGIDRYRTETRYVGEETGLPQSSVDKFVGLHYVIESTGTSAREARDLQVQGVYVVAPNAAAGEGTFGQIGSGLDSSGGSGTP